MAPGMLKSGSENRIKALYLVIQHPTHRPWVLHVLQLPVTFSDDSPLLPHVDSSQYPWPGCGRYRYGSILGC